MDGGDWWAAVHGVARSRTRLSDFTLFFHFHAFEKEMATHSSVLAWRIPGMGEPGGLPSMGSHRVGHAWSDLAAAAAALKKNSVSFTHVSQRVICKAPASESLGCFFLKKYTFLLSTHGILNSMEALKPDKSYFKLLLFVALCVIGAMINNWDVFYPVKECDIQRETGHG